MFDLIIIGGGPGGAEAAKVAARGGLRVALCEARALGGTCLQEGCIPTKALLYAAKIKNNAAHGSAYGVTAQAAIDHPAAIARKDKLVAKLTAGLGATLKQCGVTVLPLRATVTGREGEMWQVAAGEETITAPRLLIATGSRPATPPIPGLAEALAADTAWTSTQALEANEVPEQLAIIGGGVIGLELASYYNAAGSRVTVLERLPAIGGPLDADAAAVLRRNLVKQGIAIATEVEVTAVREDSVTYIEKGQEKILTARVLCCTGRVPCADGLGLEGFLDTKRGLPTDARGRTSVPGLWAIGDVTGGILLAHVAARQGLAAAHDMLGVTDAADEPVPAIIYTSPEVACVGLTLAQAQEQGIEARAVRKPMGFSGRFMAENEGGDGFAKAVIGPDDRLLGLTMVGNGASEALMAAAVMIAQGMTIHQIAKLIFPHPTVGEMMREVCE